MSEDVETSRHLDCGEMPGCASDGTTAALGSAAVQSDWEDLVADGSVRKRIVVPGTGEQPKLHSNCLVHYVGRLQATGEIFFDTRQEKQGEPVTVVAGRDCVLTERCLCLAVAAMRVGETCELESDAAHGYGATGRFSFPSVPPAAALRYELQLVGMQPATEKPMSEMFYEERVEAAQRQRLQANDIFAAGRFEEALRAYLVALTYVEEDFMMQLDGFFLDKAQQVRAPVLLNMAACQLHLRDWPTAMHNCSQALALVPADAHSMRSKALFRRARARAELGQTDDAMKDLMSALALTPDDRAVERELARLRLLRKKELQAVDKLFKNKFKASCQTAGSDAVAPNLGCAAPEQSDGQHQRESMSVLERAFHSIADNIVSFVQQLLLWLGWRSSVQSDAPATAQQQ